jgi:hypothetical protein
VCGPAAVRPPVRAARGFEQQAQIPVTCGVAIEVPLIRTTAARVRRAIVRGARPMPGTTHDERGAGLVDAERAIALIDPTRRAAA